jgi:hypothetical protein
MIVIAYLTLKSTIEMLKQIFALHRSYCSYSINIRTYVPLYSSAFFTYETDTRTTDEG